MAGCWIDKSEIARSNPTGFNFIAARFFTISLWKSSDANIANFFDLMTNKFDLYFTGFCFEKKLEFSMELDKIDMFLCVKSHQMLI